MWNIPCNKPSASCRVVEIQPHGCTIKKGRLKQTSGRAASSSEDLVSKLSIRRRVQDRDSSCSGGRCCIFCNTAPTGAAGHVHLEHCPIAVHSCRLNALLSTACRTPPTNPLHTSPHTQAHACSDHADCLLQNGLGPYHKLTRNQCEYTSLALVHKPGRGLASTGWPGIEDFRQRLGSSSIWGTLAGEIQERQLRGVLALGMMRCRSSI